MPSFEDYREGPAAPWWVKWAFLALLAGAALAGCGGKAPPQIAPPGPAVPAARPFQVVVSPPIVLSGAAAWVRCWVPESYGPGRIRLAVEGLFASEKAIDSIVTTRLAENPPCGVNLVTCAIVTKHGQEHREATLEVRGGMCDSGGRPE